jgi:magnesium chelatase accessory protein
MCPCRMQGPGFCRRWCLRYRRAPAPPLHSARADGYAHSSMSERLAWDRDGAHWPHRQASRFVLADGLRWHVQQFGGQPSASGRVDHAPGRGTKPLPAALLLHGTGASTHSWRGLAPLLAPHFNVLAVDLPGHAFTGMPEGGPGSAQLSLPGMAKAVHALLQTLGVTPALVIGHSAGAAIGVRMCLDGLIAPQRVVGINGAFLPLGGLAGQLFSPVAKLMAAAPFVPKLFSWRAGDPTVLQKLIDSTGSTLDATGLALYGKLVANPGHAAGALGMMANWDLPQLARDLPQLATPLSLVVGSNDRTISPQQASRVLAMLPPRARSALVLLEGLGHLAHEERPDLVANAVLAQFRPG